MVGLWWAGAEGGRSRGVSAARPAVAERRAAPRRDTTRRAEWSGVEGADRQSAMRTSRAPPERLLFVRIRRRRWLAPASRRPTSQCPTRRALRRRHGAAGAQWLP